MAESPVRCSIDLDRPGKHVGHLELPRSSNTSGWSSTFVPIVSVFGGVHGDEPEGQVAVLNLARELEPRDVPGRLLIVPCASMDASRAYTRLWPSGANLNRSFPGRPDGTPDEQLADFFTRVVFPRVEIVVDMHSGGRSSYCLAWSEMHMVADPAQRRQMVDAMLAWNSDYHFVYIDIAGTGLLVGEAEAQGKIVVSTELGGGGFVTAGIHRLAASGLRNVLRHLGVLTGEAQTRASLGLPDAVILRATELDDYLLAPESGLFETLVELGERVEEGQEVGRMHFLERPDRPPEPIHAKTAGTVCAVRAIATTDQGDNVAVVAREVDRAAVLGG
jgi:N-alpha-acetyl-L-2,4-diaminobutyrate deacetylase